MNFPPRLFPDFTELSLLQISNDLPRSSGPNGRNALPGSAKKADSLSLLEDDGADEEEYRYHKMDCHVNQCPLISYLLGRGQKYQNWYLNHGCQMGMAKFLDYGGLALREGLWLRYASLQNLIEGIKFCHLATLPLTVQSI